jgi:hypothetical protein
MFKSGDKIIVFYTLGKTQKVFKAEVKTYVETRVIDKINGVEYLKPHLVMTLKNRDLELDDSHKIYKIEKEFTSEEAKKL